jgi:hypothetical protein
MQVPVQQANSRCMHSKETGTDANQANDYASERRQQGNSN